MKFLPIFFILGFHAFAATSVINPGVVVQEPKPTAPATPPPAAVTVQPNLPSAPKPTPKAKAKKITPATGAVIKPQLVLPEGDDALRLQIFLDHSLFGPGVIDGRPGLFTTLAIYGWNESRGYPKTTITYVLEEARKSIPVAFTQATVPGIVKSWINSALPTKREEQAKLKRMSYRSVLEFMAERYHTSETFLAKLNPKVKLSRLKAGDTITVPNVEPFLIESITGARYGEDPILSTRLVVVDTKANQARIYEGTPKAVAVSEESPDEHVVGASGNLIAIFPITPGKPKFIHYGMWKLRNCVEFPSWRFDKSLLEKGIRSNESLEIPPGPNSPVGIIWAGLSRSGIGMHGTADPDTIGRARSAGCIRLSNWDAIRLPRVVRPGANVEIR